MAIKLDQKFIALTEKSHLKPLLNL
jgi:hypothetical protein